MKEKKIRCPNENSQQEILTLMRELIAVPSPYYHEDEIITFVNNWFLEKGFMSWIHEYDDLLVTGFHGKNVIVELAGKSPGPTILINGHLDTVNLCNGWSKEPYLGVVEGDCIYGLGALDMKSGCCAIMLALERLWESKDELCGRIIVTLVSDEEGPYGLGTNAIIESGLLEDVAFSIVTEPSSGFENNPYPNICLGARGGYGLEVEFFGKSAHAANPTAGTSAVADAAIFITAIDNISFKKDELLGEGVACVVAVESDGGACSVPDYARVRLFWHIVIGEDEESIVQYISNIIMSTGIESKYKVTFRESPSKGSRGFMPYAVSKENLYVKRFLASVEKICGKASEISYLKSIGDFNYLGTRINAPVVVFGAGGGNIHGADEFAFLSTIAKTTDILYDFLKECLQKEHLGCLTSK